VVAGDIQIAADLVVLQGRGPRLDLHETAPALLASLADDRAVGDHDLAGVVLEANLGEGLNDRGSGRAELVEKCVAELRNRVHHGEKAGRRPLLLLLLAPDARRRNQPRGLPRFSLRSGG
jgi:hypothetical protein